MNSDISRKYRRLPDDAFMTDAVEAADPGVRPTAVASAIIQRAEHAIAKTKAVEDAVVNTVSLDTASFNSLLPLIYAENKQRLEERVLGIYASVSSSPELREASLAAARLFSNASTASLMREDIFRLINHVFEHENESLDAESAHYLRRQHQKYLDHGLQIPTASERERLRELRHRIGELTRSCQKNFNSGDEGLWLDSGCLAGIPKRVLSNLQPGEDENRGKIWYPIKNSDVAILLQTAEDPELRKEVFLAAEKRYPENAELMTGLFLARDEMARLLGHTSYASMQLRDNVAKTPEGVEAFLSDLVQRLKPHAQIQLGQLLETKNAEQAASSNEPSPLLYWDLTYYRARVLDKTLGVNHSEIAQYFPFEAVLPRLLLTFERLLEVETRPVSSKGDNLVWHPDVSILAVWDTSRNNPEKEFLGYIYLDLHPRPLKRPRGGHWRLHPGNLRENGTRHCPSSAIVFNIAKPADGKPSLMSHAEVVSLFHELGHSFRNLTTKTRFAASHGGYDTDFIETPSKLLDNFFWSAGPLRDLGKHYSYLSPEYEALWEAENAGGQDGHRRPPETLPEATIDSLVSSRYQCNAIETMRQVALAMFALRVHNPATRSELEALDIASMYNALRDEYTMLSIGHEQPGHNQTAFSHVFGHWSASYYSYLHSTAVAADLFSSEEGFKGNPFNKVAGRRWRRTVLEPGGSRPQAGLLQEFLGREPTNATFVHSLVG
ncbi:metallopeptidase [Grosmannia clavigera kw1407]|uniref:Metallopeptidase n=1 Tax=Grosmannia clavigera (strain kw1407 / UAMH 11150) TaxID=655863 RepID=F0XUI5_GROCL|nr:metallopeptidase [Grosmannia clavigera kw1407]EFW99035.1 metallopeptidase [Grosmannia clavigera kw1407]